jgi:hypothetical protein
MPNSTAEIPKHNSSIDGKIIRKGLLPIALIGIVALIGCALSSHERIQAQTVDICTYQLNSNRVLYEGGIVDVEGADIDAASGAGGDIFLVNPFVVTGGRGKTQQLYLVGYQGNTFSPRQWFVPKLYAIPLESCESVTVKIGSYDPSLGFATTTEDGREIRAGKLRIEKRQKN